MNFSTYSPKKALTHLLVGTSVAASVFMATTITSKAALAEDTSEIEVKPEALASTAEVTAKQDETDLLSESPESSSETSSSSTTDDILDQPVSDQTDNKSDDLTLEKQPDASATSDSTFSLEPKTQSLSSESTATSTDVDANQTISDGVYTIGAYGDSTKLVEAKDINPASGSNVQIDNNDSYQNQRWKFYYNTDRGYYSITINGTNQALTVSGGVAKSGANVIVSEDTKSLSQLWRILTTDGGYRIISALNSSYVLDIMYGSATVGANLEIWQSNGNPYSQTFKISKAMSEVVAQDSIDAGIYAIHTGSSSTLYVAAANTTGASLQKKSNATNQRFYIQDAGSGFFRIISEDDGGALAVQAGSSTTGASLVREGSSNSPSQLWAVKKNTDSSYTFINRATGQVLDLYGGSSAVGTTIGAWVANGQANQKFYLEALNNAAAGEGSLINDGSYYIVSSNDSYFLAAEGTTAGSKVTLANAQATQTQTWQFSRIANSNYYTVGLSGTNLVLDASGATPSNGAQIIVWTKTGGANQQWKLVKVGSGYALVNAMRPDLVIDLKYAQVTPSATVQTYTASGGEWQSFKLRSASTDVENRVAIDEGVYTIGVGSTSSYNYALDIPGGTKVEGTQLILYTKNGGTNQKWLITSAGNSYYYIVNMASGVALDATGASITAGTKVIQWRKNSGMNQMWAFVKNTDGSYKIVNRLSGLVLDVDYGNLNNLSNVSIYYDNNQANQKWWLTSADYISDGYYKVTSVTAPNYVWDVPGLSSSAGTQLALYTDNNQLNQRYQVITGTKSGTYRIRTGSSGGFLSDVSGAVQQVGSSASQETANALWKIGWNGKYLTLVNVGTGRTLTASSGIASSSKLITAASQDQSESQAFVFTQATLLSPGYTYNFINKATGGSLTSEDGSIKNATNVVTSDNSTSSFAKFTVGTNTDGSLTLVNSISRLLVDVSGGALTSGTNVILYTANGGPNQAWTIEIGDGGGLILRNVNSKLSLAVDSKSDNNNVIQKTYDSDDVYQLWLYQITTSATRLNGIDISSWDKGLNVRGVEGDFVIVKSTEGTHYTNPYYKQQIADALAAGKLIGFYHYANGGDAVAEATYFYNSVKDYIGQAVLVLDWEGGGNLSFGKTDVSWSKTFLDTLYKLSGVRGLIYMSKSVTYAHDWSSVAASYPLWVAQYADMTTVTGYQSNPWTDSKGYGAWNAPTIFQYSSMGRPGGWNLSKTADLDVFYGSASDWIALARKH